MPAPGPCVLYMHIIFKRAQGSGVRDTQNETRLILLIFWFGKPPHTHRHARTHTHIHTHIYLPSVTEFLFSSLSPLTRRARSNGSCRNSISFAEFFFSQKSWSLISVLSKPTPQHLYSDFLLLPTNLPFIHCLKKKKKSNNNLLLP